MSDPIDVQIDNRLPLGWRFTHVINLTPDWQIIATDEEHVVCATGDTIEEACHEACKKIAAETFVGRLFSLEAKERIGPLNSPPLTLADLGIDIDPVDRRGL